jgi:hypothetical protein
MGRLSKPRYPRLTDPVAVDEIRQALFLPQAGDWNILKQQWNPVNVSSSENTL